MVSDVSALTSPSALKLDHAYDEQFILSNWLAAGLTYMSTQPSAIRISRCSIRTHSTCPSHLNYLRIIISGENDVRFAFNQ